MFEFTIASSTNETPSNNAEKAIKSLEETLERKLNQIIAVMNASSCGKPLGKPTVGPGIFCQDSKQVHFKVSERTTTEVDLPREVSSFFVVLVHVVRPQTNGRHISIQQ